MALPPSNFDWSNSGLDSVSPNMHAADLALAALQPQFYGGVSSDAYNADPMLAAMQDASPFTTVGMPPLPSSFRSKGGGVMLTDDFDFPLVLSTVTAGGISGATGGTAGAITTVFSVSTNLVDGGRKRKSGEDVEGARELKKARKERSDTHPSGDHDDNGPGGSGNAANSAATTKQRKKHSDAGKRRANSMRPENAPAAAPAKPRKKAF
jgi:hypothetical protein